MIVLSNSAPCLQLYILRVTKQFTPDGWMEGLNDKKLHGWMDGWMNRHKGK